MKTALYALALYLIPLAVHGQIIQSNSFFDPDFRARRAGAASGTLTLQVNNTSTTATQASGNTSWTHNAGGFVQTRSTVIGVADLDVQLAAYTRTVGDSLVFGREITTSATLLGIPVAGQDGALNTLVNNLAGASPIYGWSSTSTVSGLTIAQNQLYQASFRVTSGAGLPVNLLTSSTFGISTAGVTGASNESAQLLNLLGVVNLGTSSSTGVYNFVFKSSTALNQLQFQFAATTGVGVSALGGAAANQDVLTFSEFQVVAVPEASTASMAMLCGVFGLMRRRRR